MIRINGGHFLIFSAIISALILVIYCILKRKEKIDYMKLLLTYIFINSIVGIVSLTLFPIMLNNPYDYKFNATITLIPFDGLSDFSDYNIVSQNINNILLFIPFGFFFGSVFKRTSFIKLFKWSLLLTLSVETLQFLETYFNLMRRAADITDVILNTLGAIIGYGIYRVVSILLNFIKERVNNYVKKSIFR